MKQDKEARERLAARLRELMSALGLSGYRMAKETGWPQMTVQGYWSGQRWPRVDFLIDFSRRYGVDLHALLTGQDRSGAPEAPGDPARMAQAIREARKLLDEGLISEDEFEEVKKRNLERM